MTMQRLIATLILIQALAVPALAAGGGGGGNGGGGAGSGGAGSSGAGAARDGGAIHDRARSAVERHEILPLKRVLATVRRTYGGRVIEVELERRHGRYVYELKLISADGHLLEVEVDAATGQPTDGNGTPRDEKEE